MPLITETYYLSLTQDNRGILRLRCSQDDTLRTVNLKLYNNGSIFVIPSGVSASISGVKQNGAVFSKPCTISQDRESVVLQLSSDITNIDGIIVAEIVLNDGEGGRLGTSNFIIQIEKNPIRAGIVQDTETPIEYINDFIEKIQTLTARLNNLITPSGDASLAEVVDARIGILDSTTYQTLGARLNAEFQRLSNALNGVTILESTGDTTDRTSEILSKLNAYGTCKLGKGDFYVKNLVMPEGTRLVGSGISTRVVLLGSETNTYIVKPKSGCIIEDISFYGVFTGTYSELIAVSGAKRHCIILDKFNDVNSESVILSNIFINNFVGSAIVQRYTTGCHCKDVVINMCYAGIDISNASYDGQCVNTYISNTKFGIVQNGSNFVFSNCISKDSVQHIMSDQQNTECTFSSCTFFDSNLETTSRLAILSNARNGFVFDNCIFDSSLSMLLVACDGIVIKGTNFVGSDTFVITVSNGRNTLLLITDCIADVEPTVTNAGTAARITSCYLKDGTAWSISEADITVDDELSDESENPVQNKVINGAISELKADLSATKMQTALYNAMNLVAFRPVKSTRYQGNTTNNGITYEWHDDNTCTVSGTASSMSFNNIYSDNAHFPSWLKKGETYVFKGGTNVSLEFYVYKSGSYYYGLSVKSTEKEYTIPVDIDGLIMRLQVKNGVTVNETVLPVCRKKNVPSNTELYDLLSDNLFTPVTIEDLEWTYGGLDSLGNGNNSYKRVRYKTKEGRGAFWVPQGTEILAASGYKFNVALYSAYQEEGNFTLIGYRGLRVGTYTVPKDCYIRVSVGNIADDILWTTTDGVKAFTDAGVAAQSALTITGLTPIPLNERVEKLEGQLSGGIITPWESAIELKDEIPLNALDFHALFDDLLSNGKITRTLLANIGNDARYPVYLYTLRNDMNHISTDYSRVIWDGSNELYHRPKIWLTGGIHGNERTMPFVIYSFIEKLTNNIYYLDMLNAFDWYFVPLVNPWGFSHSARDKTTGEWVGGGTYTAETKDNYDVYENTVEHHLGIRSVESGLDANRDFTTFATQEAQLIRDALISLTADGRNFAFAIDAHLSTGGGPSDINALGAFMSPGGDASQSVKEFLFSKWMQAGAKSESIMADYCGVNNVQTVFAWDGTSDARIMRNYLQGYTDNAMCFEGGQTCVYYSGTTNWSNDVARTFCNTQYHLFLKKLTEYWM